MTNDGGRSEQVRFFSWICKRFSDLFNPLKQNVHYNSSEKSVSST